MKSQAMKQIKGIRTAATKAAIANERLQVS
jgi:hypothetical protein